MHHQYTRRNFFQTAGLALAATPLRAINKPLTTPVPLSPALLSGVSLTVGKVASRIRRHTATPQDMQAFAQALEMLGQHFAETGVNQALQVASQRYTEIPFNPQILAGAALVQLQQYDAGFTLQDLSPLLNLQAQEFGEGIAEIQNNGLSRVLAHPQDEDGDPDAGNLGGYEGHICPEVNYYLGGFAAAAFILQAIGCTPEPVFLVLCPTITVVNLILGASAAVAWVLC